MSVSSVAFLCSEIVLPRGPGVSLKARSKTMNPDSYIFTAECPQCKEQRGVSCSRNQARTGEPIEVYAIACDHRWRLTPEDSKRLRELTTVLQP